MDRSRQLQHLEEAERHLLRGEQKLTDQKDRMELLERHGHETT